MEYRKDFLWFIRLPITPSLESSLNSVSDGGPTAHLPHGIFGERLIIRTDEPERIQAKSKRHYEIGDPESSAPSENCVVDDVLFGADMSHGLSLSLTGSSC